MKYFRKERMDNMGKRDQERDIYEEMDNLKLADDDYRHLVYEVEAKIDAFIAKIGRAHV